MRKVPKLRFPEFSGEWEKDKLNNHAEIYDGTHQTPSYKERGIRFVSVENIKDILGSDKFISEDAFEKEYKNKMPEKGDILMTRIGDIGTPAYIDFNEKIAYYVTLALIKCNSTFVYSKFLYYLIQGKNFQKELDKRTLHIAFPKKINLGEIGLCSIDLPIIPEQQKIADFLSVIDSKIERKEEKLKTLEEMKKGFTQKIFSKEMRFKDENGNDYPEWEEKKLGEIAKVTNGNFDVQDASLEYIEGYYPFFDRSEIIKYLSTYTFDNEAIIYPGEGKDFLPRYHKGKYALHQRCYSIYDANNNIHMKYLYYFMQTKNPYFQRFAVGSTVPSLRMDTFIKANVNIPSLQEQEKIANFLSLFDEKIEIEKEALDTLKDIKKGLLQQMFV